jgi:hypothetical protein
MGMDKRKRARTKQMILVKGALLNIESSPYNQVGAALNGQHPRLVV